ncbi:MAG: proline-rich domain-containing protein [Candidatus Xenobiia bacterium LiM19]
MRYELPYDSDSQKVTAAVVKTRLKLWKGEALLLKPTLQVAVQGDAWPSKVSISGQSLIMGNRAAQFYVELIQPFSLKDFLNLIAPRKPIQLTVTLFPDIAAPAPGIPVPVSMPPVTSKAEIQIPKIPVGRIECEADCDSCPQPGVYLTARVVTPSFLQLTPLETEAAARSIYFRSQSSALENTEEELQRDCKRALFQPLSSVHAETLPKGSYTILVTAELGGEKLSLLYTVSIDPPKSYELHVSASSLSVTRKSSAGLAASVIEVDYQGNRTQVPDAAISILPPGNAADLLKVEPLSARGELQALVTQLKPAKEPETALTVKASVKNHSFSQSVGVRMETFADMGLDVEAVPPGKVTIAPSVRSDKVTLRAKVVFPPDQAVAPELYNSAMNTITFECTPEASLWVTAGPSRSDSSGWMQCEVQSRGCEADAGWPQSADIVVKAQVEGREVSETVTLQLIAPPELVVSPESLSYLANPDKKLGKAEAKKVQQVALSLSSPLDGNWKFTLAPEKDLLKLVTVTKKDEKDGSVTYDIALIEPLKKPDVKAGPLSWHQNGKMKTSATDGSATLNGPDLSVTVYYEGLFVDRIYTLDRSGIFKWVPNLEVVPLRIDLPLSDKNRVSKVKFSAMVWNGTQVEEDKDDVDYAGLEFEEPKSDNIDAQIVFKIAALTRAYNGKGELSDYLTWSFSIDKVYPARGEKYPATIDVKSPVGIFELPLELWTAKPVSTLGTIEEERKRCVDFITDCIPQNHWKEILDDLDGLRNASAQDYHDYLQIIWKRAYEIWHDEQKDLMFWETGWGAFFIRWGERTKMAGDFCFAVLIGYYASIQFGPAYGFMASMMIPIAKDIILEFYEYYLIHGGGRKMSDVVIDFCNERFVKFFVDIGVTGVDIIILHGFDPYKNPRQAAAALGILFVWKFVVHWERDVDEKGKSLGVGNALLAACQEVTFVTAMMLMQKFVDVHGNKDLKDIWKMITEKRKGQPGQIPGTTVPPEKPSGTPPEKPSGTPPEKPSGTPPEKPSGTPPEKPSGTPPEKPSGTPPEKPSGTPPEKPSGTPPEKPSGTPPEKPSGTPPEKPSGTPPEESQPGKPQVEETPGKGNKEPEVEWIGGKADDSHIPILKPQNTSPENIDEHFASTPGLGGVHATYDLGGHNPNNPNCQIQPKHQGSIIKSVIEHIESKPKDTPWTSTTTEPSKALEFNSQNLAQIDIPENVLSQMLNKTAVKAPYSKMGPSGSKYANEQEWCFTKIPKQYWKHVTGAQVKAAQGPKILENTCGDQFLGLKYYINEKGQRVFRFYRGLNQYGT